MPPSKASRSPRTPKPARNHIAEWFGHRVYPVVAGTSDSLKDQQDERCPFLTRETGRERGCVKKPGSRGVCTISTSGNGDRQDWLVCPFRVLEPSLLEDAVRRLFKHDAASPISLVPALNLNDQETAARFRTDVRDNKPCYAFFQKEFGGEIALAATERSPEFSFDVTIAEIVPTETGAPTLRRYGVLEIQTMDFHGSYASAVRDLSDALRLHRGGFAQAVSEHPEWPGNKIEGPNIANVFKRTFYQMMFKFQIGMHANSAGCVFAVPAAVWDSWQKFLGKPDLSLATDGTFRLSAPGSTSNNKPNSWIYVFEVDPSTTVTPNEIRLSKVIGTDAAALSYYALKVAPDAALAEGSSADRVLSSLRDRLTAYLPDLVMGA
ncbi:hypothetical protein DZF91_09800 [Actinomadura logoneensis]|uniref:Uncharacterized protein n=1 Tax=Actinomadura logoneensis TaxID=2293572 RepID=A0A372JP71_9ACTN|nr:NotI family restriction endonuclease [Actinomadura logoneensis]RFU41817.1 hypothetical protein DZF91_09800 [Actinomadura logoneensis]